MQYTKLYYEKQFWSKGAIKVFEHKLFVVLPQIGSKNLYKIKKKFSKNI
jgi:hypothetical protein